MTDPDPDCPPCHGQLPDDLVRQIKSANPVGKPMTAAEFTEWLKKV